jgi:hypothetical protein
MPNRTVHTLDVSYACFDEIKQALIARGDNQVEDFPDHSLIDLGWVILRYRPPTQKPVPVRGIRALDPFMRRTAP